MGHSYGIAMICRLFICFIAALSTAAYQNEKLSGEKPVEEYVRSHTSEDGRNAANLLQIVNKKERFRRDVTSEEPCTENCPEPTSATSITDALTQQDQLTASCIPEFGSSLLRGRDGRDGRDGRNGEPGLRGQAGSRGVKGEPGEKGDKGDAGRPGQDSNPNPGTVGATYVRWGRTSCPASAQLVYEGVAAGGWYTQKGGAANYLCLPLDPDFLQVDAGTDSSRDLIYGTEYETNTFPPLSSLHDHDVPCAVCRVTGRGTMLMIPAKTECPTNWTNEYKGYLMSAHYNHDHQSEYVCIDENAEARIGTHASDNGALLYPVEARCGSGNLPCLPYINGHELACVICTI